MKKREIPFKNYIILLVVIASTILLCLYITQWYKKAEENNIEQGMLAKNLPQVTIEEFQNYVMENPNIILYVSVSTEENTKRFEKNIYNYIKEENLLNHFVYIDASKINTNNLEEIMQKKEDRYLDYKITPNIYVFKDGKVEDVLYKSAPSLHSKEAIRFIKKQDVVK